MKYFAVVEGSEGKGTQRIHYFNVIANDIAEAERKIRETWRTNPIYKKHGNIVGIRVTK